MSDQMSKDKTISEIMQSLREIDLIYQSVQEPVKIMEAQDLKVTFFYDQE